ncbi:MAG: hypothetical protein PHC70_00735 [Patescibacteria group bacterium]|jgi:hypothetical protein|nr:hypothetical protein [Patescibacteria group bacterium]
MTIQEQLYQAYEQADSIGMGILWDSFIRGLKDLGIEIRRGTDLLALTEVQAEAAFDVLARNSSIPLPHELVFKTMPR